MVYPACAGIDRYGHVSTAFVAGLPRMRGDRPGVVRRATVITPFTPHARGSTPSSCAFSSLLLIAACGRPAGARNWLRSQLLLRMRGSTLTRWKRIFSRWFRMRGDDPCHVHGGVHSMFTRMRGDRPCSSPWQCLFRLPACDRPVDTITRHCRNVYPHARGSTGHNPGKEVILVYLRMRDRPRMVFYLPSNSFTLHGDRLTALPELVPFTPCGSTRAFPLHLIDRAVYPHARIDLICPHPPTPPLFTRMRGDRPAQLSSVILAILFTACADRPLISFVSDFSAVYPACVSTEDGEKRRTLVIVYLACVGSTLFLVKT